MRILVINPILYSSDDNGILPKVESIKDTMIYGMCRGFLELGHRVTLIAADDYKPLNEETHDFDVLFFPSIVKKILKPISLPCMPRLYRYLYQKHSDFDLIICSEVFSFASLCISLICPRKAVIWHELTEHNRICNRIPSLIWYNVIARIFMSNVQIVPRSARANEFISKFCSNTQKLNVDHGVDINNFQISQNVKKQFICVSQLVPRKNVDVIIDKFYRFVSCDGFNDFILYIAGRGELMQQLQKKVIDLNIQNNVCFLGFVFHEQLAKILSESQALLLDTSRDLNVVSIPEALACGTPVITNRTPALAEFIELNKLGLVSDVWGEEELKEVVRNPIYRENCKQMRDEFSNTSAAEKIIRNFNGNR